MPKTESRGVPVIFSKDILPSENEEIQFAGNLNLLLKRIADIEKRLACEPLEYGRRIQLSEDRLAAIAISIYRQRRQRAEYFDDELFGEPAWDMLLDLFINKIRGARVSTSSLCIAANVPHATALRWIKLLEDKELLRRRRAIDDARVMLVEITRKGYLLMKKQISDVVLRFEMPLPE